MKNNQRDAIVEMIKALNGVFKKFSRYDRTQAWHKLTTKEGDKEMAKFLQDPNRPINTVQNKKWD